VGEGERVVKIPTNCPSVKKRDDWCNPNNFNLLVVRPEYSLSILSRHDNEVDESSSDSSSDSTLETSATFSVINVFFYLNEII
jgi:hypothetical protein